MGEELEAITRKLTRAQREALTDEIIVMDGVTTLRWQYRVTPACRCALQRKGLWRNRMYSTEYTSLGLAVRAHLLAEAQGGSSV